MSLVPEAYDADTREAEGYKYETTRGTYDGLTAVCKQVTDDPRLRRRLSAEAAAYETLDVPTVPDCYHYAEAGDDACLVMQRFERYLPRIEDWDDETFRHNLLDGLAAFFDTLDAFEPPDRLGPAEREMLDERGALLLYDLQYNNDEDYEGEFDEFPALRRYKEGITAVHDQLAAGVDAYDDVVHGDPFLVNMALAPDGCLRGVFDFEKVGYGDRVREYAAVEASIIDEFYASDRTTVDAATVSGEFRDRVSITGDDVDRLERYRALQHFHVLVYLVVFPEENEPHWNAVGTAAEARTLHETQLEALLDTYA